MISVVMDITWDNLLTEVHCLAVSAMSCRGCYKLLVADSCLMAVASIFRDWLADLRKVPADWVTAWRVSV